MRLPLITLAASLALLAAAPALAAAPPHNINAREENQQDRIAAGVDSGALTAAETARLEGREASIDRQEARMRARDAGHLTAYDRRVLEHRLNGTSRAIHRQKHDGQIG